MSDIAIRGFETKLTHNRRCEGCGRIVGPDSDVKNGLEVRDGEVTGFFHSRACFENTCNEFAEYKKKMGGEQ